MNKETFLSAIRLRLADLPPADVERSLAYYREMIDDRMEDGMSEAEAVAALGTPEEAAGHILEEAPLPALVKARPSPGRTSRTWGIVLLVLGSPVWLPLVLTGLLLVGLTYLLLVLFLLVFYVLTLSAGCVSLIGLWLTLVQFFQGRPLPALMCLGVGLTAAGLCLLMTLLAREATLWDLALWKHTGRRVKRLFIRKEDRT